MPVELSFRYFPFCLGLVENLIDVMLLYIDRCYTMSCRVQAILGAISLEAFNAEWLFCIFGCFPCFFLLPLFVLYPTTLCKQLLLVRVESNQYLLRIDGSISLIMLMLRELPELTFHELNESVVKFGGGPIVVLYTDSCGKHLNLKFGNDVEDSKEGEEFYQSALDPSDQRA